MKSTTGYFCIGFLLFGAATVTGCAHRHGVMGVDCCADIPAGAIPEPAGTKVCNWQTLQVTGAAADQTALYRSDFVGDSTTLSPAAKDRMGRLIHSGCGGNLPWIVEPSGDSDLDLARVESVVSELTLRGASPIDVTLATPAAIGLTGPEAERIAGGLGQNRNVPSNASIRNEAGRFGLGGFGGLGGFRGGF